MDFHKIRLCSQFSTPFFSTYPMSHCMRLSSPGSCKHSGSRPSRRRYHSMTRHRANICAQLGDCTAGASARLRVRSHGSCGLWVGRFATSRAQVSLGFDLLADSLQRGSGPSGTRAPFKKWGSLTRCLCDFGSRGNPNVSAMVVLPMEIRPNHIF